jgi:hypothetical protein
MTLLKWTALLCLTCSIQWVIPTQSFSEQYCFKRDVADQLATDIKYQDIQVERLDICFQQYSSLKKLNTSNEFLVKGLRQDKIDITVVKDTYKQTLINTNKQLEDCEASKPSRLTWFTFGAVSSVVAFLAGLLLIK